MTPTSFLQTYLQAMRATHASGAAVAETSYYPALTTLLDGVGATLHPAVRCVLTLRNQGAGLPDGGLFTVEQLGDADPGPGQLPARGVVEVKGVGANLDALVASEQVARYLGRYGLVLATNYRAFALVGLDAAGQPMSLDAYELTPDEASFWATPPAALVAAHGETFVAFLQRAMQSGAPLSDPADVAWFLASYAREALARVEAQELAALAALRGALEVALGIRFEGSKGEHFFRSTLVQTLFYGLFSAWVLWQRDPVQQRRPFDWRLTPWLIRVPMIRALFEQVATPSRLEPLGLVPILDRAAATLARVERDAFFARFEAASAVQYFYEPFLEQFDPALRRQLGVWYTPPEIVRYMVARVDQLLREGLGLSLGLADESVVILDPACGTGAYLVEVLRAIARTLVEQGEEALLGRLLRQAARERVIGFELLPAPFVVAHLQLGLLLHQAGASMGQDERAAVFLTNALTGWDERAGQQALPLPPELQAERDAAGAVKQRKRILVVLGNPPYNGYAGVAIEEERALSDAYRTTRRAPRPQGQGLNDLYIRFFRMAERAIVEETGEGVVCFISNYSWLDGLSFTGMRERYLEAFDQIWIDNLHGDRIISEYAPDRRTSETIFAMRGSSVGIKVGTAIALLVAKAGARGEGTVLYRDHDVARADERRAALLQSLTEPDLHAGYQVLRPVLELGLPFKPRAVGQDYLNWPRLTDLFPVSFPGVKTSRDEVLVEIDRPRLEARMRAYFDSAVSHEEMARLAPKLMESSNLFDPIATRNELLPRGFLPNNIIRYCYRPFDVRWLYWEADTKLLDRSRPDYASHVFQGNLWLEARQRQPKEAFDRGYVTSVLADNFGAGLSSFFPLTLAPQPARDLFAFAQGEDEASGGGDGGDDGDGNGETQNLASLRGSAVVSRPNLTAQARDYLAALGAAPDALFFHVVAILHAPAYREENAGALRQDWPRVPLPATAEGLAASAALGRRVAALLDPEQPVAGVSVPPLAGALRGLGALRRTTAEPLRDEDFALTAGWGYAGRDGITMPGRGRVVQREATGEELALLSDSERAALGAARCDVYLNEAAYWSGIPERVWAYTLGGYQVLKKWLSYREAALLGRALTLDEMRYVSEMARRVAALLLLEEALDESYGVMR